MSITILSRTPEQKIARPWNTGCSKNEVAELLGYAVRGSLGEIRKVIDTMNLDAIDTDEPVLVVQIAGKRTEFYAYTDRT